MDKFRDAVLSIVEYGIPATADFWNRFFDVNQHNGWQLNTSTAF